MGSYFFKLINKRWDRYVSLLIKWLIKRHLSLIILSIRYFSPNWTYSQYFVWRNHSKIKLSKNLKKKILIDGFPKTLEQALYFEKHFSEIHNLIYFDCTTEIMNQRLEKLDVSEKAKE